MALVESQGLENEIIPRIASGLGGGMGGSHELVCGALSGGAMASGVLLGRDMPDEGRPEAYDLTDELISGFRQEFGTVFCHELVGKELGVEPRAERWGDIYRAKDMRQTCVRFVRFVTGRGFDLFEEMTKE